MGEFHYIATVAYVATFAPTASLLIFLARQRLLYDIRKMVWFGSHLYINVKMKQFCRAPTLGSTTQTLPGYILLLFFYIFFYLGTYIPDAASVGPIISRSVMVCPVHRSMRERDRATANIDSMSRPKDNIERV